ncbi:MAG: glycosyltransferase family 1 protein [Mycobacteriales bacterium]
MVTESFLPQVNGVTNSVLRVCEHLEREGHSTLVVAPGPGPTMYGSARVVRAPSLPLPGYTDFRLARPWAALTGTLRDFAPDVIHLASPTVLGAQAAFAARRLKVPVIAVYQTDLAGFAARYGLAGAERSVWRWLRQVHELAARTLAPSRHAVDQLRRNGVHRVSRWARGVDLERFSPAHRDEGLRAALGRPDELVVGYVGRLAPEKQLGLLAGLADAPGVRLVVIGDGPQRGQLERELPHARFLGFQQGAQLATTYASLDVFVHTGGHETFCQAAQEGLASGLPVVAPAAGGLLDLVDEGRTGHLFRPSDALDLRTKVLALAADPQRRLAMAQAARSSVEGRGWDVIGRQLMQHYEEVASA